jgi:hypothetical protein
MRLSHGFIALGLIAAGVIYAINTRVRYGDSARSFIGLIVEYAAIGALGFGAAWGILWLFHGLGGLIG